MSKWSDDCNRACIKESYEWKLENKNKIFIWAFDSKYDWTCVNWTLKLTFVKIK